MADVLVEQERDLAHELHRLGGGGRRGAALALTRYWPVAACGLSVPQALTGVDAAQAVFVLGALSFGAMAYAERLLSTGAPLPELLRRRGTA